MKSDMGEKNFQHTYRLGSAAVERICSLLFGATLSPQSTVHHPSTTRWGDIPSSDEEGDLIPDPDPPRPPTVTFGPTLDKETRDKYSSPRRKEDPNRDPPSVTVSSEFAPTNGCGTGNSKGELAVQFYFKGKAAVRECE